MACSSLAAEDTMRDDPAVIALVARARDGDQRAWNEFVDRYAPLGWSVRNLYRLSRRRHQRRRPDGVATPGRTARYITASDRQWTARCHKINPP